ncbi:hypothetical protein GCM10010124_13220 [Pilimelia terevasa]|uniref:Secreted protein n=1 Tax=Pilimelia terevasa TaxID=53372 RepID=A0A8J3FFR8_9ACTN|nr:DUF4360 domain-containing protein [Pilimelia terevasa]GGK22094.1 hypothetical protein GCM10010124_13220 [Pilimelia terevasa]
MGHHIAGRVVVTVVATAAAVTTVIPAAAAATVEGSRTTTAVPPGASITLTHFGREGCNKDNTNVNVTEDGTRIVAQFRGLRVRNGTSPREYRSTCAIRANFAVPAGWRFAPRTARVAGASSVVGAGRVKAETAFYSPRVKMSIGQSYLTADDSGAIWTRQHQLGDRVFTECGVPIHYLMMVSAEAKQNDPAAPAWLDISRWDVSLSDLEWREC